VSGAFRRILVATDFSPASAPAFERALELAKDLGAHLTVVHAYQDRSLPELGFAPTASFEEWDREARAQAEARLAPLVARAREAGIDAEGLLAPGFPDEAVVEAARRRRADLIVVGTHGRRGAARLVLGSVAARVLAAASCPVLTERGGARAPTRPPP
jgi:nucleotide-binding universal stress UspA family protein